MKYKCPCCGYYTLAERDFSSYEICPVCFWENDGSQRANPALDGGANDVSLTAARLNFEKFGACEEKFAKMVRSPDSDELNGEELPTE